MRTLALVLGLALATSGCGSTRAYASDPGPYDRVPESWREVLAAARLACNDEDYEVAYQRLAPLASQRENAIPVRIFLQEIELALLERDGRAGEISVPSPDVAGVWLAEHYRQLADARPSAAGYVLAARLESNGEQALALLDEARELDPSCVWIHYGRAWWNASLRRFREARESVRAAFKQDGGHPPTLRLHAAMLAGAGETEAAAAALDVWLDRTAEDPLIAPAERAKGLLDLAALRVLLDDPSGALELLDQLDPRALVDPARAEEVRAAAHQALGDYAAALAAVHRASELEPSELLPLVQEAMLLAENGDHAGERAVWERLLEHTVPFPSVDAGDPSAIDFEGLLFRLQAHTRLERLQQVEP